MQYFLGLIDSPTASNVTSNSTGNADLVQNSLTGRRASVVVIGKSSVHYSNSIYFYKLRYKSVRDVQVVAEGPAVPQLSSTTCSSLLSLAVVASSILRRRSSVDSPDLDAAALEPPRT